MRIPATQHIEAAISMASTPQTPQKRKRQNSHSTPTKKKRLKRHPEANTPQKARYFESLRQRPRTGLTLDQIAEETGISTETGRRWRKFADQFGEPEAQRRSGKHRSERPSKIAPETFNKLLDPTQNRYRDQAYEVQIDKHNLKTSTHTLQRSLKQHTGARRFKKRKVKLLSDQNKMARVEFAKKHENKTVQDFWQFVHFTDEAHYDSGAQEREYILRRSETVTNLENIQEMTFKNKLSVIHFVFRIFYYDRSPLIFYNDEKEVVSNITIVQAKKSKPVQDVNTDDVYEVKLIE